MFINQDAAPLTRNKHIFFSTKWHFFVWLPPLYAAVCVCASPHICSFYLCVLKFFQLPLVPICPPLPFPSPPRLPCHLCRSAVCQGLSQRSCSVPNRTSWKSTVLQISSEWAFLQYHTYGAVASFCFAHLQCPTNLIKGLFWSVLYTFSLGCSIQGFFARVSQFFSWSLKWSGHHLLLTW